MNILVSEKNLDVVKANVKNLLLYNDHLFVIDNLKTEVKTVKGFFRNERKEEFITNIEVLGYNYKGKFVGVVNESEIERIVSLYDFYQLRNNWLVFKEQLEAFGFKINKIVDVSGDN